VVLLLIDPHGDAAAFLPSMETATTAETCVSEHKFRIGQSVQFTSNAFDRGSSSGVYKVTGLLPPQNDGDRQYRIKSADEPHERVVKESQLGRR